MRINISGINNFSQLYGALIFEALRMKNLAGEELLPLLRSYFENRYSERERTGFRAELMANLTHQHFLEDKLEYRDVENILAALNIELGLQLSHVQPSTPHDETPVTDDKSPVISHPWIWDQKIEALGLDKRPYHCLQTESLCGTPIGSLDYVGQLVRYSEAQLRKIPQLGAKGLANIVERLTAHGLKLETDTAGWLTPAERRNQPQAVWNQRIADIPELVGYVGGCLANDGVRYVGQLIAMHPKDLSKIVGVGKTTERKIKDWVKREGLEFNTNVGEWKPPQ
jgi:DNA-directed RNA polymerase alpha subunit